jgi:hypothetical protein
VNLRKLLLLTRWTLLIATALFVGGVGPFAGGNAGGLSGDTGPITVTISPAVNLGDGQVVTVHAKSNDPGTVIFAMKAHLCHPGVVKGDTSFSLDNPQCTSVPIGQSDVEQRVAIPGGAEGELRFKVGTGTATWITTIGLDGSLTCDAANPCELVLQTEITNGTVYFRAPLCYGSACPADTDPNVAPVPAPAPPAAGTDGGAGGAAATPEASDSASGKSVTGANANAVGSVKGSGTSHSSSHASGAELASAQSASAVSVPGKGLSRGVRVLLALVAGAIGGALIVAIVNHSRTRGRNLGNV